MGRRAERSPPLAELEAAGHQLAAARRRIARLPAWPLGPVTARFGVVPRTPAAGGQAAPVEEADRALHASRRSGRNRVTHLGAVGGGAIPAGIVDRPASPGRSSLPRHARANPPRPWLSRPGCQGARVGDERAGSSRPL